MNPNPRPSPPWKGLESRTGEGAGGAAERLRESLVRAPRASLPSLGQLSRPGDVHLLAQRPVCVGVCPHGPHGTPLGRHARGPCFTVTVRAEREGAERSRRCSSHNSATLQLGHLGEAMRLPARLDAGLTPRACPPRRQAWVGVARPGTDPGVRGLPAGPRLPGAVCASGRRGQGLRAGTHFASPCPGTGCWRSDGDTEHPAELGAPPRGLRSSPATLVTVPGDGFWGGVTGGREGQCHSTLKLTVPVLQSTDCTLLCGEQQELPVRWPPTGGRPASTGPGALQTHIACGRKHVRGSVSRGNTRVSHESSTRVT